ncbi:MAG: hypothetical protein Q9195_002891 [Heterodermia aff. obscurata]
MALPPWGYDLYPEEELKVGGHFMLMPKQEWHVQVKCALNDERKEKRIERAWLLQSLTDEIDEISSLFPRLQNRPSGKMGEGTLERLDNYCLKHVMHHARLEPDLWNLLGVSERCRAIWEESERSILIGMQEEKFPDYIDLFGKIGSQNDTQLHNLASALATDAWKLHAETYEPERSFLDLREDNVRFYQRCLILYLESTDEYFNDRVQLLHELGSFEPCSQHVTKRAVLALWRIGWSRRGHHEWTPGGSLGSSFTVAFVQDILNQQPGAVRSRIRDILHLLASKIDQTSKISSDMEPWVEDQEKHVRQGMALTFYNVSKWYEEAINATIVMEIVLRGIGGAVDHVTEITRREGAADEMDQVRSYGLVQIICASRVIFDEFGFEDLDLHNLKKHVQVARELGVDIFAE